MPKKGIFVSDPDVFAFDKLRPCTSWDHHFRSHHWPPSREQPAVVEDVFLALISDFSE